MLGWMIATFLVAPLMAAPAVGQVPAPPTSALAPASATPATGIPVRSDGLVGTWFPPASGKRGPAIITIGGSEGGERGGRHLGRALVAEGYGVLALAYFGAEGLPKAVQDIPLEYFDTAVAWLTRQPLVDTKRIGLWGVSIGGETALVVAARRPEIKAVVAAVPSSVVWQGFNPADYETVRPTYTLGEQPVSYLPYDQSSAFTSIFDLYNRSLAGIDRHPQAIIPVERIGGAILLVSARDDKLWPSTAMSDAVMARLKAKNFPHPYDHLALADAGHTAVVPPVPNQKETAAANLGGTPEGNAAARVAMWTRVRAFFARNLGRPAR